MSDALIPDPELADPVRPARNTPWLTVHLEHHFHHNGTGFHLHLAFSAYAQRTVVFGPSGSGKSSLLRAIAGLLKPDVATIQFHGTPVCDTRAVGNQPTRLRSRGKTSCRPGHAKPGRLPSPHRVRQRRLRHARK